MVFIPENRLPKLHTTIINSHTLFINGTEINVDIHKLMYKTIQKESTITTLRQ